MPSIFLRNEGSSGILSEAFKGALLSYWCDFRSKHPSLCLCLYLYSPWIVYSSPHFLYYRNVTHSLLRGGGRDTHSFCSFTLSLLFLLLARLIILWFNPHHFFSLLLFLLLIYTSIINPDLEQDLHLVCSFDSPLVSLHYSLFFCSSLLITSISRTEYFKFTSDVFLYLLCSLLLLTPALSSIPLYCIKLLLMLPRLLSRLWN